MEQILIVIHVLIAVFLIVLVLVQQGKGATMGAAFGSGASATVFGSQGSGGFLLKLTALFAALFFVTSLALGYMAVQQAKAQQKQTVISMPQPIRTAPVSSGKPATSKQTKTDSVKK